MACSGHERTASATPASWSAGTWPWTGEAVAVHLVELDHLAAVTMAHIVCPWQRSGSTCTFTVFSSAGRGRRFFIIAAIEPVARGREPGIGHG